MALPAMDAEAGPSHSPQQTKPQMEKMGEETAGLLDPALMDEGDGVSAGGKTGSQHAYAPAEASGSGSGSASENEQSQSHTQSPAQGQHEHCEQPPHHGVHPAAGSNPTASPSAQSAHGSTSHPPGSAHSHGQASMVSGPDQAGMMGVTGEDSMAKRVGGKANVSSACGPCKRAHLACDVGRPCKRCVNLGKEGQCEDVPHKKRGRPKVIKPTLGHGQYARLREPGPGSGSPGPPPPGAEYGRWRMQPPSYGQHGYMHGPPPGAPGGVPYGQPPYAPTGSMPPPPPGEYANGAYPPTAMPMAGPGMPPAGMPPGAMPYRGPVPPVEEEPYPPTLFTVFTTPDLRVIRVSSAVTYLTGFHPPEFVNLNLLDWVHRDDRHLLDIERSRLIDTPFGTGGLSLDRDHHMAVLHRSERDLLSPAMGMREPYPNQNIRFLRPDQHFSHFNARLHLGGGLGGSLWQPDTLNRFYLVISLLLLPPGTSVQTSVPASAAPRATGSSREYVVPAPLTIAPDSRRSSFMGYAPPTPMTPGSHQPLTTVAPTAAMTPTSLTGTTPGPTGGPGGMTAIPGTLTPGGPLSAAPGGPPGTLPSFSSVVASADSPTLKMQQAPIPQSGYYTPTGTGPSISVSAPPSAVASGRTVAMVSASPGMSMSQAQAQAHAQNQAHAQHHHSQHPHAQHSTQNGVSEYTYDRVSGGRYETRTPSPEQPLDPAVSVGHGNGDTPYSRINGASVVPVQAYDAPHSATAPSHHHAPAPSSAGTGGYADYPPPLQLQEPYYDARYEYRREAEWVPRDAQEAAMGPGAEGGTDARAMEHARTGGHVEVGQTSPGEYGRRVWE